MAKQGDTCVLMSRRYNFEKMRARYFKIHHESEETFVATDNVALLAPYRAANAILRKNLHSTLEATGAIELTPELTLASLKLCNDSDGFTLTELGAADWNVCVQFDHSEIDIDIQLETESGEFIASSATKEDLESISFTSVEGEAYLLTVYSDLRSSGIGTYTIALQTAPCTSQP